ncbi:MAG: hypothetical protein LBQ96_09435 [Fusobacteriaceae bacterium]|jgi:hypothetical protein|nr:hypothetical protein [Fusobacteriaceae bacterium]
MTKNEFYEKLITETKENDSFCIHNDTGAFNFIAHTDRWNIVRNPINSKNQYVDRLSVPDSLDLLKRLNPDKIELHRYHDNCKEPVKIEYEISESGVKEKKLSAQTEKN